MKKMMMKLKEAKVKAFTLIEMRDSKIIDFFKKIKKIAHPY